MSIFVGQAMTAWMILDSIQINEKRWCLTGARIRKIGIDFVTSGQLRGGKNCPHRTSIIAVGSGELLLTMQDRKVHTNITKKW
jgi:hypothetical protein